MIQQTAQIDMRLKPFGPDGDDALVDANRVFDPTGVGFASDGVFE